MNTALLFSKTSDHERAARDPRETTQGLHDTVRVYEDETGQILLLLEAEGVVVQVPLLVAVRELSKDKPLPEENLKAARRLVAEEMKAEALKFTNAALLGSENDVAYRMKLARTLNHMAAILLAKSSDIQD